jgi:hypothetical protein
MTEQVLSDSVLVEMRQKGLIEENEIALQVGDKLVAEHVLTRDRRVLTVDMNILTEGGPKLLKS